MSKSMEYQLESLFLKLTLKPKTEQEQWQIISQPVFGLLEFMNVRLERRVELELFGSSRNGFGLDNCEVDINLTIQGLDFLGIEATRGDYMERIGEVIRDNPLVYSIQIIPSTSNGVPELKFLYNLYGKKYTCHLFFYNSIAIYHTDLLRTYSLIDPRASALGCLIKYWARRHNLLGYPMIPSYAWTLMVIHYLQQKKVLPYLQELAINNTNTSLVSPGYRGNYYPSVVNSWDGISSINGYNNVGQQIIPYSNYGGINNYSGINRGIYNSMAGVNPGSMSNSYNNMSGTGVNSYGFSGINTGTNNLYNSSSMYNGGNMYNRANMYNNSLPGYNSMNGFHGYGGQQYNVVNNGLLSSLSYDTNRTVPIYNSMNSSMNRLPLSTYGGTTSFNSGYPMQNTTGLYNNPGYMNSSMNNQTFDYNHTLYPTTGNSTMYNGSMMPYNDGTIGMSTITGFLPKIMVHGCNVYFFRDVNMLSTVWPDYGINQESLTTLLYGFFDYYSMFDYEQYVISIRENPFCVPSMVHPSIVVEDPFIVGRNVTNNITSGVLMYHIKSFLINARNELRIIIRSHDGDYMTGEQIIGCLK